MHRHLYAVPRPVAQRPAKVVQLEVRRQLRHERAQDQPLRPRPRPAA
jgi:hypothetical protein